MLYGLYLSATGVMTSSYRQDVIANNLANSETVGFKRDLALFQQRPTEAQENPNHAGWTNPDLEPIGGGLLASPTAIDVHQGELEPSSNPLDVALLGRGYFAVEGREGIKLTRDGQFIADRGGRLMLANGEGGQRVLDVRKKPIIVDPRASLAIDQEGVVTQNGLPVARVGMFDVPDPGQLKKEGGNLMSYPDAKSLKLSPTASLRNQFVERSNVDTATELVALMDSQRQLEANANMIRYQDQTLGRLVNDVGKIS